MFTNCLVSVLVLSCSLNSHQSRKIITVASSSTHLYFSPSHPPLFPCTPLHGPAPACLSRYHFPLCLKKSLNLLHRPCFSPTLLCILVGSQQFTASVFLHYYLLSKNFSLYFWLEHHIHKWLPTQVGIRYHRVTLNIFSFLSEPYLNLWHGIDWCLLFHWTVSSEGSSLAYFIQHLLQ